MPRMQDDELLHRQFQFLNPDQLSKKVSRYVGEDEFHLRPPKSGGVKDDVSDERNN